MPDQNNAPERIKTLVDKLRAEASRGPLSSREIFSMTDPIMDVLARADRAAPEGQVLALENLRNVMGHIDTPIARRHLRINEDQPAWLTEAREFLAALTPPPAAPTDNTALVEQIGEAIYGRHERGWINWPLVDGDVIKQRIRAALACREAPPAAQEPVAWQGPGEKPHEYSPDYMAMGDCRICGHTCEDHYPSPPARQQEAVAAALKLAAARLQRLALTIPSTTPLRAYAFEWAKEALRALKGDQK